MHICICMDIYLIKKYTTEVTVINVNTRGLNNQKKYQATQLLPLMHICLFEIIGKYKWIWIFI